MDEGDTIYRAFLFDVYRNMQHKHSLEQNAHTFSYEMYNAACGDKICMHIAMNDTNTTIQDMSFTGEGCLLSSVSAELLADQYIGEDINALLTIDLASQLERMGIHPAPTRMKCIELPLVNIRFLALQIIKA